MLKSNPLRPRDCWKKSSPRTSKICPRPRATLYGLGQILEVLGQDFFQNPSARGWILYQNHSQNRYWIASQTDSSKQGNLGGSLPEGRQVHPTRAAGGWRRCGRSTRRLRRRWWPQPPLDRRSRTLRRSNSNPRHPIEDRTRNRNEALGFESMFCQLRKFPVI